MRLARQVMTALETDRLILRPFERTDITAYAQLRCKPEVVRYLPGGEAAASRADEIAGRSVTAFASLWFDPDGPGYGPWAAIDRRSGALIGHIGLRRLDDMGGETEILYMLDSAVWGQGMATEGALAARDFAFQRLKLTRMIGMAAPENAGSLRVMEKIGMRRTPGLMDAFGMRVAFCSMSASDASGDR